jgi:class 3 adenylate cyclase/tetratricopeptide (TPR) repeat protein
LYPKLDTRKICVNLQLCVSFPAMLLVSRASARQPKDWAIGMECLSCSHQNRLDNEFCENCGSALGATCAKCGRINQRNSRFCGMCGGALAPSAAAETTSLTQSMLSALSTKGGERKLLTVLFADIRDSTSLIDSLGDPEIGVRRLKPVLELMMEAVHRYDGIVNKVQGDGVMALFGAPRPHEDHAVRGCLAGLAMQEGVARLEDPRIQIRVGLHTGEVVVQTIENSIYQTYDAAGTGVHLANRLEQMAEGGGVLISKATYNAARQFIEVEPLGERAIRGLAAPVEVFNLAGLRNAPASGVFRSGPRLNPMIGRSEQRRSLEHELANAEAGHGGVVGIVGEAGIGKSRLCYEFSEQCRRNGIRVYEARVLEHGSATPLQPILELIRDYFGIRPSDDANMSRQRVLDRIARFSVSEQTRALLLDFLGLADTTAPPIKLDPKARKQQLMDLLDVIARSGSSNTATVILIEDLHWIDAASLEFIETLADATAETTTLLVANFRPGFSANFMRRGHYRQISLSALAPSDAQQLLRTQLGDDPSLSLLNRNIVERAQGNPFFLEELVNVLVERGDFEGAKGSYRLKGGIDAIPLPNTVQAVITARIDRLDNPTKLVLETAAVIGREVAFSLLRHVAGLSEADLDAAIQRFRQSELLYEIPPFDKRIYAFRHPLIQEVAYRSLMNERRRSLHAAIAAGIAELTKDRGDEQAGLLAYHLEQSGQNLAAAQQHVRAAIWIGANDSTQALRNWKKVRELLMDQPSSQMINYLRMLSSGQIVNFGWREGISASDSKVYFDEARELAVAAGDMRANALIHAAYGRILANGGSADEYASRVSEAKALAEQGNDESTKVTLKAVLSHALWLSGRLSESLRMNLEATEGASQIAQIDRETLGFDIEVWLKAIRGRTLVLLGRPDEARSLIDELLELSDTKIDVTHHAMPSLAYVDIAWARRDGDLAQQHADRAFSLAFRSGSPYLRVYAQASRGLAHAIAGRLTSAIEDLSGALNFARTRRTGLENEARILADLADVYRRSGDRETALGLANEAIEIAGARHTRIPECLARIVRARLWSESKNDNQLARDEAGRARALMEESGAFIFRDIIDDLSEGEHKATVRPPARMS